MEEVKSGFSLRHGFFIGLVLALALSSFEFSETDSLSITGQAMGVDTSASATLTPAPAPGGMEIKVTEPTVSFVPISTLSELANTIETTRSRTLRVESLERFRVMVSLLPEGVNRSFYESELARLKNR